MNYLLTYLLLLGVSLCQIFTVQHLSNIVIEKDIDLGNFHYVISNGSIYKSFK